MDLNDEPSLEVQTLQPELRVDSGLPVEFGLRVNSSDVDGVSFEPSYEPTDVAPTDFSGFLPDPSFDDELPLSEKYEPDRIVQSAWKSLPTDDLKLPWETGFWDQFFDPNISAWDMMHKGFKRPVPAPVVSETAASSSQEVDRRVASKPFKEVTNFLQHVRDVSERTWKEEREAVWETSIRRWVALLENWDAYQVGVAKALQEKQNFSEKAQILVDVFYNKAPQTLMKRVNSLLKMTIVLRENNTSFPCTEDEFYRFLKLEAQTKCSASRLKAYFEAVVFVRHVLGVECLQTVVDSRRCLGAASSMSLSCPHQADPFTVKQLGILHDVLRHGTELWDRAMSGMLLFCTYGRSRWSDAQHAEALIEDTDEEGQLQFLEIRTSVHKTARALHLSHMFLPVVAPCFGVTHDCWGEQWMAVRRALGITDLSKYPLMPAPDSELEPTKRPISTNEAKRWMHYLLGAENMKPDAKLTSHSCKCTCLSYMAKRGVSFEDRLVLGYHSNKLRVAMVYSRDSAARPLALLSHVLSEIRDGVFEPDNTRSGRLKQGAKSLAQMDFNPEPEPFKPLASLPEVSSMREATEAHVDSPSWQKGPQPEPEDDIQPELEEGHVTTDSSDSSNEENPAESPVVGHYVINLPEDKRLWLNHKSKMFHLAYEEHERILLCGRRISGSFTIHTEPVRYDSAKCKQCFRLKDQ